MAVIETVLRFRYIMNYKVIPTFLSHRILPCALLWLLQLPALIVGPCLPRYHLLNCFSRRFSFSVIWSSALFEVLTDASTVWCCVLTFCCCLFFFSIAERGSDLHMAGLAKSHGVTVLFTNAIKVLSGQLGAFEVDPSWKECGVQDIIENSILCRSVCFSFFRGNTKSPVTSRSRRRVTPDLKFKFKLKKHSRRRRNEEEKDQQLKKKKEHPAA